MGGVLMNWTRTKRLVVENQPVVHPKDSPLLVCTLQYCINSSKKQISHWVKAEKTSAESIYIQLFSICHNTDVHPNQNPRALEHQS